MAEFLLHLKLHHLCSRSRKDIEEVLFRADILLFSLNGLRGLEVSVRHCIELTDTRPVFPRPSRISPMHDEIIKRK